MGSSNNSGKHLMVFESVWNRKSFLKSQTCFLVKVPEELRILFYLKHQRESGMRSRRHPVSIDDKAVLKARNILPSQWFCPERHILHFFARYPYPTVQTPKRFWDMVRKITHDNLHHHIVVQGSVVTVNCSTEILPDTEFCGPSLIIT